MVSPEHFDADWALKRCEFWLTQNYSWFERKHRMPEWAYRDIKPGIILEELLIDAEGLLPLDFKFHVFGGKAMFVHVIQRAQIDPATGKSFSSSAIMDSNWERLPMALNRHRPSEVTPSKPKNFELMLELAEKLSAGIDFVRVDLYNIDGRIYFGELTNYPNSANNIFEPKSYDQEWGKLFVLDKYK